MENVNLKLPTDLLKMAHVIARQDDVTVGQVVRRLLIAEFSRRKTARPRKAADERFIASLCAGIAREFSQSQSWDELQARLRSRGYHLREAGSGLALHSWPSDKRLCNTADMGFSYGKLLGQFKRPFPGHSYAWVAEEVLRLKAPEEMDSIPV